jgi:hypothetical protein
LEPNDTPHKAPLHQFWFYRGTAAFQIAIFTLTAILSLCFCLGWKCHYGILKTALWILQVAQQNRNMTLTDGSDSLVRHLLLWCCRLPLTEHWSMDTVMSRRKWQRKKGTHVITPPSSISGKAVSGLPCLAIVLQIVLMYAGTVFHYTTDMLGNFNGTELTDLEWLPPQLSAVHYALSGAFFRHNVLTVIVRSHPTISRMLTALILLVVSVVPLACLLLPATAASSRRHWPALILVLFHASLYLFQNNPNWVLVGMLCQVLWIPSAVWDQLAFDSDSEGKVADEPTIYKKTDGDDSNSPPRRSRLGNEAAIAVQQPRFLQYFFVHDLQLGTEDGFTTRQW